MQGTALHLVPKIDTDEPIIRPKFLTQIAPDTTLKEVFVYSQRDFFMGASAHDLSRAHDPKNPPIPEHNYRTLVDLGGEFTKAEVQIALKAQQENEDPKITTLREMIVAEIEERKLFYSAVRTPEDAHRYGIVFPKDFPKEGEDPYEDGMQLGILAYDT
jgi:hypothetical protein